MNQLIESPRTYPVTKARSKLSPKAFIEMNHVLLKEFYTDNSFGRFHGLITMAIDGSTLELPADSPEILQKYGCATNQTKSSTTKRTISSRKFSDTTIFAIYEVVTFLYYVYYVTLPPNTYLCKNLSHDA